MSRAALALLSMALLAGCGHSPPKTFDAEYFSRMNALRRVLVADFLGPRELAHAGRESFIAGLRGSSRADIMRGGSFDGGFNEARQKAVDLLIVGEVQSDDTKFAEAAYSLVRVFDARTGKEVARIEGESSRYGSPLTPSQRVREASGRAGASLGEILR